MKIRLLNILLLLASAPVFADDAALRARFEDHLATLAATRPLQVAAVRAALTEDDGAKLPLSVLLPAALGRLDENFAAALQAFDEGRNEAAAEQFAKLAGNADPFIAGSATWFRARAQLDLGRYEAVQEWLAPLLADEKQAEQLAAHTPFAPQLWLTLAACQWRNLEFEQAEQTLAALRARFDAPPEIVDVGARQLGLELSRREKGTLGEVAEVMDYSANRLNVADPDARLATQQERIIDLLDKLIEQREQQEQQNRGKGGQGGQQGQPQGGQAQGMPQSPPDESTAPPTTEADMGELHGAPKADPGEAWGKLPPAERERILQAIRERYPSRYRQLVEQYYRSLAEEQP